METTNYKTDIINVDDTVVFTNKIIETFVKIDAFATKNNYICNIKYHSDFVTASNVQGGLTNLSRTQKKVLRNLIHGLDKKITLKRANRFLHHVMKVVLKSELRIKFQISYKEQEIDAKRKIYKDALAVMKKAYADYKEEKGDFYKNQN